MGARLPDLRLPVGWRGWRKGAQMWGRRGGAELGVCAGGSARRGYDRTNGMRGGGPDRANHLSGEERDQFG